MVHQHILIDIFLYNPCDVIFTEITNKELALKLLREQRETAEDLYFLRSKGDIISKYVIIDHAIVEDNMEIFKTLVDTIGNVKGIMYTCVQHGRLEMNRYLHSNYCIDYYDKERASTIAAKYGHMNIVEDNKIINRRVADGAAEGGHTDMLESIIDKVKNMETFDWNMLARYAARGGHRDIVMSMIKRGANDINGIAVYAAKRYHITLLNELMNGVKDSNGVILVIDDWNNIAQSIAKHCDIAMLTQILNKADFNLKYVTLSAARYGHREIVKVLIERGANNYSEIACRAAEYGHLEIVLDMIDIIKEEGAIDWNKIAIDAAEGDQRSVLNKVIELSQGKVDDWDCIVEKAREGLYFDILDDLTKLGVNEFVVLSAAHYGRLDVLRESQPYAQRDIDILLDIALNAKQKDVIDFLFEMEKKNLIDSY